jgi:hypothetical protein
LPLSRLSVDRFVVRLRSTNQSAPVTAESFVARKQQRCSPRQEQYSSSGTAPAERCSIRDGSDRAKILATHRDESDHLNA